MAGMFKKILTSAVAAKVIQEARKPQNQQKIKDFVAQMQAKRKGGYGGQTKPGGSRY